MTLAELINYLDQHSGYPFLDGDVMETLTRARAGDHKDPYAGEFVAALADGCNCGDVDCLLQRADAVKSLGQTRLKYMKDDAPVEGFRLVEKSITTMDAAFNEEALREKQGG